jgi:hypothetical protein
LQLGSAIRSDDLPNAGHAITQNLAIISGKPEQLGG